MSHYWSLNDVLKDLIMDFRSLGLSFNLPASDEDLSRLEQLLQVPLLNELRELYRDHNGMDVVYEQPGWNDSDTELLYRLLSIDELINAIHEFQEEWFPSYPDLVATFLPCWTNDGSDYAVIYIDGPLKGYIAEITHDTGEGLQLSFQNTASFYEVMINSYLGNSVFSRTFPRQEAKPEYDITEGKLFDQYMGLYRQETDKRRRLNYAFNAIALCPYTRTNELYEFVQNMDSGDLEVPVCKIFAMRSWQDAIPLIGQLITQPGRKFNSSLINILGNYSNSAAVDELIKAAPHIHPYNLSFLVNALEKHNCEIQSVAKGNGIYTTYSIRKPDSTEWITLRGHDV